MSSDKVSGRYLQKAITLHLLDWREPDGSEIILWSAASILFFSVLPRILPVQHSLTTTLLSHYRPFRIFLDRKWKSYPVRDKTFASNWLDHTPITCHHHKHIVSLAALRRIFLNVLLEYFNICPLLTDFKVRPLVSTAFASPVHQCGGGFILTSGIDRQYQTGSAEPGLHTHLWKVSTVSPPCCRLNISLIQLHLYQSLRAWAISRCCNCFA